MDARTCKCMWSGMQDFKLNTLRWHLLPKLGQLLIDTAAMINAPGCIDYYRRDLGPSFGPTRPVPTSQHSTPLSCEAACMLALLSPTL